MKKYLNFILQHLTHRMLRYIMPNCIVCSVFRSEYAHQRSSPLVVQAHRPVYLKLPALLLNPVLRIDKWRASRSNRFIPEKYSC
jgi:hypothetical protein